MAWWLQRDDFYPPHLTVANWNCHVRKGVETPGRCVTCLACDAHSNTRTRNGDARFIRAHRRCVVYGNQNFNRSQT